MIVMVSGGFDPLHVGHLSLLTHAARYGHVIVALNSDDWLRRKKGYNVMSYDDRLCILKALSVVTTVTPVNDTDGTVCEVLQVFEPDWFANGGDRTTANAAESAVCEELGINQLFGIGGGKIASSSELVRTAFDYHQNSLPR